MERAGVEEQFGREKRRCGSAFRTGPRRARTLKRALRKSSKLQRASELGLKLFQRVKVEVAFAGEDDGEEAAVGGKSKVADDGAAENGIEIGLRNGNFVAG